MINFNRITVRFILLLSIFVWCNSFVSAEAGLVQVMDDVYQAMLDAFEENDYPVCADLCGKILENWPNVLDQKDTVNYYYYALGMIDLRDDAFSAAHTKFQALPSDFYDSGRFAAYSMARMKQAQGDIQGALDQYALCEGILDTTVRKIQCYAEIENSPQNLITPQPSPTLALPIPHASVIPTAYPYPTTKPSSRFSITVYEPVGILETQDTTAEGAYIRRTPYKDDNDPYNVIGKVPYGSRYPYHERVVDHENTRRMNGRNTNIWYHIILPDGRTGYINDVVVRLIP